MAIRRMFSQKIVSSDAFLEMPSSSQLLYFHLGMYADDDGFISPRKIMRMMGASEDDLRMLIVRRFVLPFENGVIVIKHWKINNLIRKDFYSATQYLEEKATLKVKENGSYTELPEFKPQIVNNLSPQVRLGKDRLKDASDSEIVASSPGEEEDIRYVAEDEEGNPMTRNGFQRRPKSAGPAKNTVALRISHSFEERAKKVRPSVHVPTGKAYLLALGAMKQGLTEPQIYNLFDDWFANEPEEKAVNIGGALSTFNINRFKVRENL